jgi:ribosomal protein RSM22 (predicted rRNA methylase)
MLSVKLSGISIGYYPRLCVHEATDDVSHAISPRVKRGIYRSHEIVYERKRFHIV